MGSTRRALAQCFAGDPAASVVFRVIYTIRQALMHQSLV